MLASFLFQLPVTQQKGLLEPVFGNLLMSIYWTDYLWSLNCQLADEMQMSFYAIQVISFIFLNSRIILLGLFNQKTKAMRKEMNILAN